MPHLSSCIAALLLIPSLALASQAQRQFYSIGTTGPITPPTATQEYDFLSASLPSGLTFTRASVATDIINGVLTSFSSGNPRISTSNGLRIEEGRTNNFVTNTQAAFSAGVVTPSVIDGPDGVALSGYRLGVTATTNGAGLTNSTTYSHAAVPHTVSAFVKAGTSSLVQLIIGSAASTAYINVNLSNGTVVGSGGSPTASGVIALANGWYRIWMTVTTSAASGTPAGLAMITSSSDTRVPSKTWAGTENIYFYGLQGEVGSFLTSYIPTTSAAVTRVADVVTVTTPSFLNSTAGSMSISAKTGYGITSGGSDQTFARLSDGTTSNYHGIRRKNSDSKMYGITVNGGTTQADISSGSAISSTTTFKASYGYAANNMAFTINAANPGRDLAGSMPSLSEFRIGAATSSADFCNCWITNIKYWNTRLSNGQLMGASQ